MTRLWNDPADFSDEMIDGFVAANSALVRRVPGGVTRRHSAPAGQVAVVIGGGSGHYPAFGGLVGSGLAHAAAMGNLFASPSAQQVRSVASAAEQGGGVLLCYGNYAGDVLNFSAAQEQLTQDGIACQTVIVTDDISSARPTEIHKRRGVAGDLPVFRAAAAAAEAGYSLDEVARVATTANERTRTFGVAFSGCTLPGAEQPLFSVAPGRMAVGLGIHGEPGIGETDIPTADDLAAQLVAALLDEIPEGASLTVVPILNGLGSLKYEELFVVFRRVAQLLEEAGLTVLDPHVGEYCTSFDMAGLSLTLFWPDDELANLWNRAVDTPGYRRHPYDEAPNETERAAEVVRVETPHGDEASQMIARAIHDALTVLTQTIDDHVDDLGRLDAVAGDGDHGIGMQRGARAALAAAALAAGAGAGARTTLERAGAGWADRAGGTSGALWGIILSSIAEILGDQGAPTAVDLVVGVERAARNVMSYGGAQLGDKTMVDAIVPFTAVISAGVREGASLQDAARDAAAIATRAAAATADLLPRMGRARPHAEKSLGTPDPGAYSFALIVDAIAAMAAERQATF